MDGTLVQINVSRGGLPKRSVAWAEVNRLGLAGDEHAHPGIHGGPEKAVLLICAEVVDELAAEGFPVYYGALGENLTIRGIDRMELRAGMRLRVGQVVLELTKVRTPCRQLDVYGADIQARIHDRRVKAGDVESPVWAKSGFYAAVVETGRVEVGDIIALLDQVV